MTSHLHGRNAFSQCSPCGSCIDRESYVAPPGEHNNLLPAERRADAKFRIRVGVVRTDAPPVKKYYAPTVEVALDATTPASVFTATTADLLDISDEIPAAELAGPAVLPIGSSVVCVRHDIGVVFGNGTAVKAQRVPVHWPVSTYTGQLRPNTPAMGNVLRLADVLRWNMVCLTTDVVYVVPRKLHVKPTPVAVGP